MCVCRSLWTSGDWFLLEEPAHPSVGTTLLGSHASLRRERYSYLLWTDSTCHTDVLLLRLVSLGSRQLLSLSRWRWRPCQDRRLVMEVVQPCPNLSHPARTRNKVSSFPPSSFFISGKSGKIVPKVGKVGQFPKSGKISQKWENFPKVGKFPKSGTVSQKWDSFPKVGKFPKCGKMSQFLT